MPKVKKGKREVSKIKRKIHLRHFIYKLVSMYRDKNVKLYSAILPGLCSHY